MAGRYELDMRSGSLFPKIISFTIPIILTSLLQLLYNAVDIIVVGQYVDSTALAAVTSTSSLINLIVNAFVGLSVGTGVVLAQSIGAGDGEKQFSIIHTAMLTSVIGGVFLAVVGFVICRPLLQLMGSPADVIDQATLYMKIYFLGMPGFMIYTFGAVIMRTYGDTKRPLVYLSTSGLLNVALNLLFVIKFNMGVAGVAIGTIASQYMSAILIVIALIRSEGSYKLYLKELKIHARTLISMIKVGLPVALQSSVFSMSNVLIQSSINSFGSAAIAGNGAAASVEGFLYVAMNSFSQTATTFVGQNYGARKYDRINKTMWICLGLVTAIGMILGPLMCFFGEPLLKIYTSDGAAIQFGVIRLKYICFFYAICGIMDVFTGTIRGTGSAVTPMVVSIVGVCGIRIGWIYTIFQQMHTLESLYMSYLASWAVTAIIHFFCYLHIKRKLNHSLQS